MTRKRRISFTDTEAEHIYEWLRMYWRDFKGPELGGCAECRMLGKRLEAMIGPAAVRRTKKMVAKYP